MCTVINNQSKTNFEIILISAMVKYLINIVFSRIAKVPEVIDNVKKFVTIESLALEKISEIHNSAASSNIDIITEQNRLQDTVETLEV